jgi:hypothetical protein
MDWCHGPKPGGFGVFLVDAANNGLWCELQNGCRPRWLPGAAVCQSGTRGPGLTRKLSAVISSSGR